MGRIIGDLSVAVGLEEPSISVALKGTSHLIDSPGKRFVIIIHFFQEQPCIIERNVIDVLRIHLVACSDLVGSVDRIVRDVSRTSRDLLQVIGTRFKIHIHAYPVIAFVCPYLDGLYQVRRRTSLIVVNTKVCINVDSRKLVDEICRLCKFTDP